jgi:two-component system, chemotaxis family, protein-glutamate methylesterase/glutaminase
MNQRASQFSYSPGGDSREKIRVLVVDDSAFMRHVITRELTSDSQVIVIGAASNGLEAISMARELRPDVITLDIEMPKLDGLGALPRVLEVCQARVIMLSSNEGVGQANTVRALELGAVDFILKPTGSVSPNLSSIRDTLLRAVHGAATATVHRLAPTHDSSANKLSKSWKGNVSARRLVIIGSSTGGPQALTAVLPHLPADLDAGVVVVQHMPAGFTASLASRLNDTSALRIREAASGDVIMNGEALVAPGDYHLRVFNEDGVFRLKMDQGPRVHGVRPSVDVAFGSASEAAPGRVFGVVLTGMGRDGTAGAGAIRDSGGWVLAQDEASCVIYGMPRSVIEAGFANAIFPLKEMSNAIVKYLATPSAIRKGV